MATYQVNHCVLRRVRVEIYRCLNYLGIDLSCCYLLMAEHLADCIDVRTISQLQGSIGMAKAVKGDVLGDTRGFYPSFHRSVNP